MFSNPTAVTFIGYLILMVLVGIFAYYYTRNYADFILGGRSLGGFVTAFASIPKRRTTRSRSPTTFRTALKTKRTCCASLRRP